MLDYQVCIVTSLVHRSILRNIRDGGIWETQQSHLEETLAAAHWAPESRLATTSGHLACTSSTQPRARACRSESGALHSRSEPTCRYDLSTLCHNSIDNLPGKDGVNAVVGTPAWQKTAACKARATSRISEIVKSKIWILKNFWDNHRK